MKGISIKRFECYLLYLLSIHVAALFIFFIFRFTLFCSIDYQFPAEIKGDVLLQSGAFLRGLWFDNVIACYILLLPLVVLWVAALCNYTAKWLFRFTTVYFSCFYSVSFVIAAANIPYFEYFFKTINSSIYNWFGYGGTTAGLMFGESSYYFPIFLGLLSIVVFVWGASSLASYFYPGLPTVLQENGYCNLFFMTHESQYDNMNAFLRTNGFDEIYAQENYPSEKVVNSFGVQDDFMYQYALPILNERAGTGNPFFSVLLSISNHPPYVIPPYFHPHSDVLEEQIVEYADWSIRQFMQAAEKQPWFDNTIFVFLGDHGKMVGTPECEMPQSYNHIPLMIYGKDIKPGVYDGFGGQVDVSPTLLGLLNISYLQNNFGVNLLEEERPCMFFTADNLIGARDSVNMFIYSPDSQQEFKYKLEEGKLHAATGTDEEAFRNLKDYCFSMLQSTESLVKEHKTLDKVSVKK